MKLTVDEQAGNSVVSGDVVAVARARRCTEPLFHRCTGRCRRVADRLAAKVRTSEATRRTRTLFYLVQRQLEVRCIIIVVLTAKH